MLITELHSETRCDHEGQDEHPGGVVYGVALALGGEGRGRRALGVPCAAGRRSQQKTGLRREGTVWSGDEGCRVGPTSLPRGPCSRRPAAAPRGPAPRVPWRLGLGVSGRLRVVPALCFFRRRVTAPVKGRSLETAVKAGAEKRLLWDGCSR